MVVASNLTLDSKYSSTFASITTIWIFGVDSLKYLHGSFGRRRVILRDYCSGLVLVLSMIFAIASGDPNTSTSIIILGSLKLSASLMQYLGYKILLPTF